MFQKISLGLLLVSTAYISGCAHNTTVREHKDLQEEARRISSVVILPEDVSVQLIAFTGENEKETAKQEIFARELHVAAKSALDNKGLKVIDFDFSKAIIENQNLAFAMTQAKESLAKSEANLYKSTAVDIKDKGKFSESIGAPANAIADATGADAMLVIRYQGFEKTAGMQAKDMAAGILLAVLLGSNQAQIAAREGASIDAALIATDSGDILWTNKIAGAALNTVASKGLFEALPTVPFKQPEPQPTTTDSAMEATQTTR